MATNTSVLLRGMLLKFYRRLVSRSARQAQGSVLGPILMFLQGKETLMVLMTVRTDELVRQVSAHFNARQQAVTTSADHLMESGKTVVSQFTEGFLVLVAAAASR